MPFNEKLQAMRKAAGLTQEGLARKAGLSTSAVVKLEQPNKEPVWTTAVKLAEALGVSLDAFTDTEDAKPAEAPAPEAAPAKKGKNSKESDDGIKGGLGVGVIRAHEALNFLTRIPKDDPLRKRGFQVVSDWIRHNP